MKPMSAMNVIPFIDVMLVLLAIVLTTATFVAQGRIPVTLPQAADADSPGPAARVEITVTRDGRCFVDAEETPLERLGERLDGLGREARVVLRVDEQAAFRDFVAVIDLLKARRLQRVSILTRHAGPG